MLFVARASPSLYLFVASMFTRAGATLGRVAATRAAAQTSVVARRAAVPVTRRAALSTEAAAADAGAASKGSIWDKLPRDPNYEGFMGVAKYYFPTNDKVRAVVECPACVCIPSSLLSHQPPLCPLAHVFVFHYRLLWSCFFWGIV